MALVYLQDLELENQLFFKKLKTLPDYQQMWIVLVLSAKQYKVQQNQRVDTESVSTLWLQYYRYTAE